MIEHVYVGHKPMMSYITACMTCLNISNEVIITARGKTINTAVDVAEMLKKYISFNTDVEIGTDKIRGEKGEIRNVSTIKIRVIKNG